MLTVLLQDEFLQTVWNQDPQLLTSVSATEPEFGSRQLFSQASFEKLPQDYRSVNTSVACSRVEHSCSEATSSQLKLPVRLCSGKTVDEVWNAIKSNQTPTDYHQPLTVGHLLEGLSAVSDSPRDPSLAAQLQFMPQQFAHSQPEVQHSHLQPSRLPDPPQLQIHSQSGMSAPSFSPVQYPSSHQGQNGLNGPHHPPRPPYMHPQQPQQPQHSQQHQQSQQFHFQQMPLPSGQQVQHLQPLPNHIPVIQAQSAPRRDSSPPQLRPGKGDVVKAGTADSMAVDIRANAQYPPAQQASQ